jgi:CDP-diacylglycerol--serine O-phosphatidyltransferase
MALKKIAKEIKEAKENIFLVYAFNATGKTRLSTAYKEIARDEDTRKQTGVYYNAYSEDLFVIAPYLPFAAFIIAVFSAIRLAKFNIDERQHHSFIGMPTPANALLIVGIANSPLLQTAWTTPIWGLVFLFTLIALTSYLLVCELPMFSLKTPSKFPYVFAICSAILTITLLCTGYGLLGLAISMVGYILSSVIMAKCCKA